MDAAVSTRIISIINQGKDLEATISLLFFNRYYALDYNLN